MSAERKSPDPLFELGRIVSTYDAWNCLSDSRQDPFELLERHVTGDWGDLDEDDKAVNDRSVKEGHRILSAYHLAECVIWIITEHDRSLTTFLLPSEY